MRTIIVVVALLQLLLTVNSSLLPTPNFCWRDSYNRGIGRVPSDCRDKDKIGLFCYSKCPTGTVRFGFDCHSVCPDGFRDDGLFCRLAEYGRGLGYPWFLGDILFSDSGMIRRCQADHGKGNCQSNGLLVYPKCKPGYSAFGCCICRPPIPNCSAYGLLNGIDLSCLKKVIIGDPTPFVCPSTDVSEIGLCFDRCKQGYVGIGPICVGKAPKDWVVCGMGAALDSQTCDSLTYDQESSAGVLNLSDLTPFSIVISIDQKIESLQKQRSRFIKMINILKNSKKVKTQLSKYADDEGEGGNKSLKVVQAFNADINDTNEDDIARMTSNIVAFVKFAEIKDPIVAYAQISCSDL